MNKGGGFFLLLTLPWHTVLGDILHVPQDFPTIQVALNTIADGDTILLAPGRYQERLYAPRLQFVLKGDVHPDSGRDALPTIDPTGLPGSDTMTCLRLPELSYAILEDIHFSNSHVTSEQGGMNIWSRAPIMARRCVFDSTRRGIYQECCPDSQEIVDSLFDCLFRETTVYGIDALENPVIAERCSFLSGSGYQLARAGDGSQFRDCHFDGGPLLSSLTLNGDPMEVTRCTFGPSANGTGHLLVFVQGLGNTRIRGNVFSNNSTSRSIIRATGSIARAFFFENNLLENNRSQSTQGCLSLTNDNAYSPNRGGTVRGNIFLNCFGGADGANIIYCARDGEITNNRFEETAFDEWQRPAVQIEHGDIVFRQNEFVGTGFALESNLTETLNAENNWWGDNSGPYHETLNPLGRGDTIRGEPVDFEPWLIDTTENIVPPPLPLVYQVTAFPNPFNSAITIEFVTTKREHLSLQIFDLTGRLVSTLADEDFAVGIHRRSWNAERQASGIYFTRLSSPESAQRPRLEKLVLLK